MIPKIFHLFWCGGPISFMRYLTFLSMKKTNPDWEIWLHLGGEFTTQVRWDIEKQDFQSDIKGDYTEATKSLCSKVLIYDKHPEAAPNFQSDFFRWDILDEVGGFYMDSDQIVLKSFNDFSEQEFVYASYGRCGRLPYGPVGVVGAQPGNAMVQFIKGMIVKKYNPNNYNSIGPYMFAAALEIAEQQDWFKNMKTLNTGHSFYPMPYSYHVQQIYEGKYKTAEGAYALHWFGGHPNSQKFNEGYAPEVAQTSDDEISRLARELELI